MSAKGAASQSMAHILFNCRNMRTNGINCGAELPLKIKLKDPPPTIFTTKHIAATSVSVRKDVRNLWAPSRWLIHPVHRSTPFDNSDIKIYKTTESTLYQSGLSFFIMSLEGLFFLSCTTTFHLGQMAFAHKASVNCHAVIYPALTLTIADTLLQMKPRVLQSFRISSGRIVAPYSWGGLPSRLRVNQSFSA